MTEISAELDCEDVQGCALVKDLLVKKRDEWASDVRMRLVGLGGLAQGLTVEANGRRLTARTRIPTEDARRLLERLPQLAGRSGEPADKDAGPR